MLALSIRNPWSYLIVNKFQGKFKNVENRTWPLPFNTSMPMRIYVHAGVKPDGNNYNEVKHITSLSMQTLAVNIGAKYSDYTEKLLLDIWKLVHNRKDLKWSRYYGAIIGEVDIIDCVRNSKSPWAVQGQYHWVLDNPIAYLNPVPYKGELKLFKLDPRVELQCKRERELYYESIQIADETEIVPAIEE